jgi:hypothetical protein
VGTSGTYVSVNTTSGVSGGGVLSSSVTVTLNTASLTGTSGYGNIVYWDIDSSGDEKLATSSMYQETTGELHQTALLGNADLWVDGNIVANFSDERLKRDFELIDNAVQKVNTLRSGTYYQNDLGDQLMKSGGNEKQVGLMAQDLLKILPEAVKLAPFDRNVDENGVLNSKSGENYLTIQYEKLVPLLVSAIQELSKEIERLKNN